MSGLTFKKRLAPFAKHIEDMSVMIRIMEDEDLKKLGIACRQVTTTNCGWSTYQAGKVIEREVGAELYRRKTRPVERAAVNGR